jgi:hypothetical protein
VLKLSTQPRSKRTENINIAADFFFTEVFAETWSPQHHVPGDRVPKAQAGFASGPASSINLVGRSCRRCAASGFAAHDKRSRRDKRIDAGAFPNS